VAFPKAPFSIICLSSSANYPHSTRISSLSLNHHHYADDTQLFFSFYPLNFDSSITHLQNALQQFPSWMTANLLTLNYPRLNSYGLDSKSKQLDKTHNSSLNITHSASNLGFIFDEHPTFFDHISPNSKACHYHRQLRCIRPYLDSTTACIIATSIVYPKTPNSITVILSSTTYLSLRLPASN